MNITLVASLMAAVAGFLTGAGLAWQLQAGNITEMELNHANERMAIQREAHKVKERQTDAVITAQNAGAARAVVLKRDADSARAAVDGLRDDLNNIQQAAGASIDACNRYTLTITKLFVASADTNRELAQICDGHASDVRTLIEAWPK
jgi:hypothetical protein